MSDYVEDHDNEETIVDMEEINDDFDNLWDEQTETTENGDEHSDDRDEDDGADTNIGDDDDPENEGGSADTNGGLGDNDEDADDDEGVEGDELELELVEDADDSLVARVEALYQADMLKITEEELKELFDGTPESYNAVIEANNKATNNMAIEQIYNSLPMRGKEFFDYLVKTNMNGDIDGWLDLERQMKSLSDYDLTNLSEADAKSILTEEYKSKGLGDKQTRVIVEAMEDNDEHVEEAKKILQQKLQSANEAMEAKKQADIDAAKAARQAEIARHQKVVEQINNTKFSKNKREELYNLIYTVPEGQQQPIIISTIANIIQNKPDQLVQLAQLFDGYDEKNGFNLERLKKQVKTETTKKTKKTIKHKSKQSLKGGETRSSGRSSGQSFDDWLGDDYL